MASTDSQNQLFNFSAIFATEKFQGENEKGIFDAVLQGHIDFESTKDLLRKMLTADPKKRITAAEVLEHPWLREGEAPDHLIDGAVLTRMKQLRVMNKLKKLALKVIAESLPDDEIQGLKQMFENMDTDDSNDNYGTGASPEYQFPGTVNKKAQMHFNPYMDLVILDLSI